MESSRGPPPPLPPRSSTNVETRSNSSTPPPPYSLYLGTLPQDPRSSSTQSLVPSLQDEEPSVTRKRTLLIVYIHGFYGNELSFQSFPHHVHQKLKIALSDTHVIHSKIYPRYKTYKAFEIAIQQFSTWLRPHESPTTDIILAGHSMGGLVAADVALMPNPHQSAYGSPYKHRILATLSLDAPLLGMHPGIIASGIASLFQPAASPPEQTPSQSSISSQLDITPQHGEPSISQQNESQASLPQTADMSFNPAFFNDQRFNERPFMSRLSNFAKKHWQDGNIVNAALKHTLSHFEYGGVLADYPAMKRRYKALRALEDAEQYRVRFVNYYTLCSGRPKEPRTEAESMTPGLAGSVVTESNDSIPDSQIEIDSRVSLTMTEESLDGVSLPHVISPDTMSTIDLEPLSIQEPEPIDEEVEAAHPSSTAEEESDIPPLPSLPSPPAFPDISQCKDSESLKQAEKVTKRLQKAYDASLNEYNKQLRARTKIIEKKQKEKQKQTAREEKEALKAEQKFEKEIVKRRKQEEKKAKVEAKQLEATTSSGLESGKKKYKKFCSLPSKQDGVTDPTWVSVYIDGVDEIGAHCGLFFETEHYEGLVEDVVERVKGWVADDIAARG